MIEYPKIKVIETKSKLLLCGYFEEKLYVSINYRIPLTFPPPPHLSTHRMKQQSQQRTSPILFTHGSDVVRNATPAQMEKARELLEQQQKRGVPLFGKGSGRGRKK